MKQDNIVLNQDTTKRHAKRLLKALKDDNSIVLPENFNLSASQELLSRALGFNNWHELDKTFKELKSDTFQNDEGMSEILSIFSSKKDTSLSPEEDNSFELIKKRISKALNLNNNSVFLFPEENTQMREMIKWSYQDFFINQNVWCYLMSLAVLHDKQLNQQLSENIIVILGSNEEYKIIFKCYDEKFISLLSTQIITIFNMVQDKKNIFDFTKMDDKFNNKNYSPWFPTTKDKPYDIAKKYLHKSFLSNLDSYEISKILMTLCAKENQEDLNILITPVAMSLCYMAQTSSEINLDISQFLKYIELDNIIHLYKSKRYFPENIRDELKYYLLSLPGFIESVSIQDKIVLETHSKNQRKLYNVLIALKNIDKEDVLIFDKKWLSFIYHDSSIHSKSPSENHFLKSKYKNELWFNEFNIEGSDNKDMRQFSFLFKQNQVWLSDLVRSLYNLSLNDYEKDIARKFVMAYPRIKKISEDLQKIYHEKKDYERNM